ncbi:MAG: hypothetical protein ACHBN1_12035 [Heteroscytonema crispum UTEX LB 1556]
MARAIERIERDIAAMEQAISAIAQEIQSAYANYLTIFEQAVRQQLILASYHLCTQGYPENFLRMSLNQRQQLQQSLKSSGKQVLEQLLAFIRRGGEGEMGREGEGERGREGEGERGRQGEVEEVEEVEKVEKVEEVEKVEKVEEINSSSPPSPPPPLPPSSSPVELMKWQQNLEEMMQHTLRMLSRDANLLLQKFGILPKKLPEPILEMAAASEASSEIMPGPPNLLNLVIEIENEQDSEESSLTQIMAINLRLGEIEFADAALSSARKQIRNLLHQLNKLGREYQKKQRERSIAEAEAAWRASWYE